MNGLKIGFTGSRRGMTDQQQDVLFSILKEFRPMEFHHGDCIGADLQAHELVRGLGFPVAIFIHPPSDDRSRAFCKARHKSQMLPCKPYLVRNHDIVDATDMLIVAPNGPERMRSGTWSTFRYAQGHGKTTSIIEP